MDIKLSRLFIGLIAAFAFSSHTSATTNTESATAHIGNLDNKSTFSDLYDSIEMNTNFNDYFIIKLTFPESLVILDLVSDPKGKGKSFSNLSLSIEGQPNFTIIPTGNSNEYAADWMLGPGKYIVDVSGTTEMRHAGMYSFTAVAAPVAAPVPEPTEGALLLSGIGLLGFITARRKLA